MPPVTLGAKPSHSDTCCRGVPPVESGSAMHRLFVGWLLFSALLGACGGGEDDPPLASLAPANQVRTTTTTAGSPRLPLGASGEVGKLRLTVQRVEHLTIGDLGGRLPTGTQTRWMRVYVRIDNAAPAGSDISADWRVLCAGDEKSANRYVDESKGALNPQKPTPPGSFEEGHLLFGLPPACPDGTIVAIISGQSGSDVKFGRISWGFAEQ